MSSRDAEDNVGDESNEEGLVGRLRKFVESDADSEGTGGADKTGDAATPATDVPSAWEPPATAGPAAESATNEPAWPPPATGDLPAPPVPNAPTPPVPSAPAPPPFAGTPPIPGDSTLPPPTSGISSSGLGAAGGLAAGAGAVAASKSSGPTPPSWESTSASTASTAPDLSSSTRQPVAPNGPDDHFGPPEPGAAETPFRERDPWPEKPNDLADKAPDPDAGGGKRDLLIGLGLIALAGLVAGGVILLNWNRDRDDDPVASAPTTSIPSSDAVAAIATTTSTTLPPVSTTTTSTPPIPTTTIPASEAMADLEGGEATSVAFVNSSPSIGLGAARLLDDLATTVNGSTRHVLVQGFAAPGEAPDEQAAVILSLSRANAVKAALVDRGIDPSRMTIFGCGTTKHPGGDAPATSEVLIQFAPML